MSTGSVARTELAGIGLENAEEGDLFVPGLHTMPLPLRVIEPAPCTQACPAGINVKAYVSLIAEGRFQEALEEVRLRCPLPGVCGRICHAPCEQACNRADADEPVAIRALKRFVSDLELHVPLPPLPEVPQRSGRVAIIGSGPAGLTAAHDLRRAGYPVTIFEAEDELGGMLRYGIAEYRLPLDVLDAEIRALTRGGVEVRTGVRLGRDIHLERLLKNRYRAVLLAMGAPNGRKLGLRGEKRTPEVEDALTFLRRVNGGQHEPMPKRVLVIGGGSTAIEAARTARRLGAESVVILYRRSPREVLASREEVDAAETEGVTFRFLVAPKKLLFHGKKFSGLECLQVGLGEEDASGRRRPITIPGSEFPVHADRVFAAVGQEVDLGFLPSRGRTQLLDDGHLSVDALTSMTRLKGVFAAGDLVTGPATVIDAIAAGHRAAASIRQLLETGDPGAAQEKHGLAREIELPDLPPTEAKRAKPKTRMLRPGEEFEEVEQVLTREQAMAEARRCLRCGPCGECRICASSCQRRHIAVREVGADATKPPLMVRASVGTFLSLHSGRAVSGHIVPRNRPAGLGPVNVSEGLAVEVRPARAHVLGERCRGCARCREVCSFDAISLEAQDGSELRAHIDPSRCRGCNLCTAVCSTDAAVPAHEALLGWNAHGTALAAEGVRLVLTCERRAADLHEIPGEDGGPVEMLRMRCVGEAEAGMLVDLVRRGARQVLVGGCGPGRCHYGQGSHMARDHVEEARAVLRLLGLNEDRILACWPGAPLLVKPPARPQRLRDATRLTAR
jgi:NADPH-dependent glutamate synthase beta subunit-like oxidoreductase/coenzyme F420-reducing hydrogenase delta subunit/Pyruvate/2-oxoacid:ferredoxin oxidoreductase delta subunit